MVYEYTNNKVLNSNREKALIEYVTKNANNLIEIDDFIFDKESLNTPIMLNHCLDCEKYQSENCCPGSPYSMPEYQKNDLKSITHKILSYMPEGQIKDKFLQNTEKVFTRGNSVVARGNKENRCIFSFHQDGVPKCAIHAYCLDNKLDPLKYKPYICSLFPLFAIRFPSNKIAFFCHNKETEPFSFYWYTLTRRPCVNIKTLDRVVNSHKDEVFKSKYLNTLNKDNIIKDNIINNYLPAWKSQEKVLRYLIPGYVIDNLYNQFS